ncbi:hypothetical protein K3495_g13195, partial [Podosphaera aphanis]
MSIPSSTIKIENGVNKTSWGNVQIYDGTNFASFESSLKDALEIAGVWKIVTGIDKEPSSISSFFRAETIRDAINSRDAAGLWKAVTTLNQKSNDSRENANLAIDNPQYTRDDYLLLPHIAQYANVVVETALMPVYRNKSSWKIDSGATRHFSGRISDFLGLKRWSLPKYVSTANGNTCPSDGYGICKIGDLVLKDVWYVPDFKDIRLISVGALNQD